LKVSWNLKRLGYFVIMISNGQPVYNFCVIVDDAVMISGNKEKGNSVLVFLFNVWHPWS
jgi:hypothetical protein